MTAVNTTESPLLSPQTSFVTSIEHLIPKKYVYIFSCVVGIMLFFQTYVSAKKVTS